MPSLREHGFCRQQIDRGGKSSAVTEASQQRTVSVSFCRGGCKFHAPQQGTGSIVWLLPSLRSFSVYAFVSSSGMARKRKTGDTVVFTFENASKRQLIFQVNFFYNQLDANRGLSSKFQSPNILFICHGDQNGRSLERCKLHKDFRISLDTTAPE